MSKELEEDGKRVALYVTSGDLRLFNPQKQSAKIAGAFMESEDNVKKWNWEKWNSSKNRLRLK